MTTKHTPGPWVAWNEEVLAAGPNFRMTRGNATGYTQQICTVNDDEPNPEGNARLIAAAPELLEALTDVAEWLAGHRELRADDPIVARARAAIAKAEGGES